MDLIPTPSKYETGCWFFRHPKIPFNGGESHGSPLKPRIVNNLPAADTIAFLKCAFG
jgi:hypothetical protein